MREMSEYLEKENKKSGLSRDGHFQEGCKSLNLNVPSSNRKKNQPNRIEIVSITAICLRIDDPFDKKLKPL